MTQITPQPHEGSVPVLARREGAVLVLTLNRPEALNAWTDEMERLYFAHLRAAARDPAVGAIVVTGAGRGFCAGADIQDLADAAVGVPEQRDPPRSFPLTVPKPLIAAINGPAVGFGLTAALYCDVRFCVPGAKLGTLYAQRGIIAEHGIAWILPRVVGLGRAMDLLLSGRIVDGEEAYRLGLVDQLHPPDEVVAAAIDYAQRLATGSSPTAMAVIKRQIHAAVGSDFADALRDADRSLLIALRHPDVAEGAASFSERRPPRFLPLDALRPTA